MTRYALDTDFFVFAQRLRFLPRLVTCGRLPIVVTDVVWAELTAGSDLRRTQEIEELLAATAGAPHVIEPQSPEAEAFVTLQAGPGREDAGEHSVIALSLHAPQITPVLIDRRALQRAVEELRRPVLSMHGFLDSMVSAGHVPHQLARDFAAAYRTHAHVPAPLWW